MTRAELIAAAGGLIAGCGIGWILTIGYSERQAQTKYAEAAKMQRNALERAASMNVNLNPVAVKMETDGVEGEVIQTPDAEIVPIFGNKKIKGSDSVFKINASALDTKNDYHRIIAETPDPVEVVKEPFVAGSVHDYGVSYIEEEEYDDTEDGLEKAQIVILMDEPPIFQMNGVVVENWDEMIGGSILVDFYKRCPPGTEPVLWVRNHRTGIDYEVSQEMP